MPKMRIVLAIVAALLLSGCASTKMTSFSDPSFKGAQYQNVVVHIPNGDLESQSLISAKACQALINAGITCTPALEVFPPTRSYSSEEKAEVLAQRGVDGYLVIILGGGSTSSQYLGSQHFGTVNVYGNYASASGSSVPMHSYSRREGYDLVLIDVKTRQKAWVGGARTSGQGLLNITDDAFAASLGRQLAESLKKAGHI